MRVQAVCTSWGGSHGLRTQQCRALSKGWQALRRSFRPSLAAASAGGSPEQPEAPQPASRPQRPPVQQPLHDAWEQACKQVAAFQRQHGRLPRTKADAEGPLLPGERPLGLWCTEQQRREAGSKGPPLIAQERAALQAVPGWCWWATKRVIKPWEQRRQEVEAFYQQHSRLPRQSAGKPSPFLPGEKELGRWVSAQRQCFRRQVPQQLSAERVRALERTPGWSWGEYIVEAWGDRYQQVQDFVFRHGRFPRGEARNSNRLMPCERELGIWCCLQRQRY